MLSGPQSSGTLLLAAERAIETASRPPKSTRARQRSVTEFEQQCLDFGMNRSTFYVYLDYSPVIARYAPGVYGLRSATVSPGLVASLVSRRPRGKVLRDYGWTPDGRVWLGYELSKAMISSGVFTVPKGMKPFLEGEFVLKAADRARIGALVCKGASAAWGLGPFFRRRGGEPGDHLALVFDLKAREVTVSVGDATLLDRFQEPGPATRARTETSGLRTRPATRSPPTRWRGQ